MKFAGTEKLCIFGVPNRVYEVVTMGEFFGLVSAFFGSVFSGVGAIVAALAAIPLLLLLSPLISFIFFLFFLLMAYSHYGKET